MTKGEDKKQLKFIEILLLVGSIIGGLGYRSEDPSVRIILVLFLISSLMYYFEVSNQKNDKIFAFFTSILFSGLITYPLIPITPASVSFWGPRFSSFNNILNYIMAISLFYVIYNNLQEKSKGYVILIGMVFTILEFAALNAI